MEYSSVGDERSDPLYQSEGPPPYEEELPSHTSPEKLETRSISGTRISNASKTIRIKKYLCPQRTIVTDLDPGEVRWFYREKGDKKWTPFTGYDSLRIEYKYRALLDNLHKPKRKVTEDGINVDLISVRGALYEVDVASKECYPIYWTGEPAEILRGTWFHESSWQPLEEGYADQIETEHLAKFKSQSLAQSSFYNPKGEKMVVHNIKFKEFHMDWYSPLEVYLYSEATSSRFYRSVREKLGMQKIGSKLHRGYFDEAEGTDKPPDITHLVFVIHGIGQKMDTGSIVKCCAELREVAGKLKTRWFPHIEEDRQQRAEFLPVEWRSSLKLDGDIVESITPHKIKGLRTILNSSAMDILYYTSPLYRSEITQGLQTELNRLYSMFTDRHPYFESTGGKISIVAHSLGCVIMYDIITGWNPIQLYDQYVTNVIEEKSMEANGASPLISQLEEARKKVNSLELQLISLQSKQNVQTPTLKFRLENFFCVGSPLAVFLALRGMRPQENGTQDHLLPRSLCKRVFNLFHPADPIAYRLEPLILKHYATILPLRVHKHDAPNKVPYENLKARAYSIMKDTGKDMQQFSHLSKSESIREEKQEELRQLEMKEQSQETPQDGGQDEFDQQDKKQSIKGKLGSWLSGLNKQVKEKDASDSSLRPQLGQDEEEEEDARQLRFDGELCNMTEDLRREMSSEMKRSESEESKGTLSIDEVLRNMEHTELEYRLDYMLKEGKMENQYISAITSHTSYWSNQDVALFVLTHLYPDTKPSPYKLKTKHT
ncbi:phospholipase DDHD1 [Lingula anatina]|uniref:Phospholipase DDHD1 n=1 Tax=Lingula anatina TaxID=7574 RepID=A0A1S3JQ63_LINAN|nr:phospholipase DDHD1 [Lingula anatina]|eukprot:XP_013412513.1 phospholipase DDHD1 [Lingula anatina]